MSFIVISSSYVLGDNFIILQYETLFCKCCSGHIVLICVRWTAATVLLCGRWDTLKEEGKSLGFGTNP